MDKPWVKFYDKGVPAKPDYPPDLLVHRFLEKTAEKFPDRPATVFPAALGKRLLAGMLTFRELEGAANRFANALASLGVKKGDRVAIHLPNSPQFVISYFGALKAGAIVIAFNPLYTAPEVERQLNDCGAETMVTMTKFYPIVKQVQANTQVKRVIVTNIKEYFHPLVKFLFTLAREKKDGHRVAVGPEDHRFADLLARAPATRPAVSLRPEDVALLQYTGGTTGVPKGAILTHRNLGSNLVQSAAWRPDSRPGQESSICVLPFFHLYGMQVGMNNMIYLGGAMILFPRFEMDPVLMAIDRYKPTLFPGVPTLYIAINNYKDIAEHDLKSIQACLSGAAPLPLEVETQFEKLISGKVVEGYGLTESGPVATSNPLAGVRKPGSIGIPFPDTELKIVDPENPARDLAVGEVGEIAIKGPQVFQGYWNRPEETAKTLREGWLITGDIGKQDTDGYFYIVERKKDMIISSGFKIFPRDVEEVLFEHPKIQDVAVVGIPDPYSGEVPKAFVVLKRGETATEKEILDFCAAHLAKYKVPHAVEFRASLPKTIIGKVLRRTLQEEAKQKQVAPVSTT